jgi:hypothetical protein
MQITVAARKHVVLFRKNCLFLTDSGEPESQPRTDEVAEKDEAWNNLLR